jgi:uncharacterized protein with HEPN domain
MVDRSDSDYLQDMLTATTRALQFVEGITLTAFEANVEKQYAVVRALEIIGEAANKVSVANRDRYPNLPWREMIGMRNAVIHGYFGVDNQVVWRTVQEDLPALKAQLEQIIP